MSEKEQRIDISITFSLPIKPLEGEDTVPVIPEYPSPRAFYPEEVAVQMEKDRERWFATYADDVLEEFVLEAEKLLEHNGRYIVGTSDVTINTYAPEDIESE